MTESSKGPWLDFERPIVDLEEQIRSLEESAATGSSEILLSVPEILSTIFCTQGKLQKALAVLDSSLTADGTDVIQSITASR